MANKDIQQLLQTCLEGYDAGLAPEECLSAVPSRARTELEPLFRQALALRVAYAASPRPEFRFQAREKLLFAAGRDVKQALKAEPDPQFVQTTRRRLLNTAGANAQEALRDVPPPRLPFWMNARRHLLETASSTPPRPAPAISARMRAALSAAVVVLAIIVAGAGFFIQSSPTSRSPQTAVADDLQHLTEQIGTAEQMTASGQAVSSNLLDELATLTGRLAEQYATADAAPELKAQLPDLIQRQQELVESLPESSLGQTLATAQELLNASNDSTSTPEPSATAETAVVTQPSPESSVEPDPTATPGLELPEVTLTQSSDLEAGQVAFQFDPEVTDFDLRWWRVTTPTLTFVIPESWSITNLEADSSGIAVVPNEYLFIKTDIEGAQLAVSVNTGEVTLLDGTGVTLRSEGVHGEVIDPAVLATTMNDDNGWLSLYRTLQSVKFPDGSTSTP